MNKVWLVMPWCFLSFSLQACFCCRERDDYEEYSAEGVSCKVEKQVVPVQKAVPLVTCDFDATSLEGRESQDMIVKDVLPTLPPELALQSRRASIDVSGGMQSPYKYMGLTKDRGGRRPSIVVAPMIGKDHPCYASILHEYRQVLESESFDYKDAEAALVFINKLMTDHGIDLVSLPGGIEEGVAMSVLKVVKQLYPDEPFSFANAEKYKCYVQAILNYAQQVGINLPEDYVIAKNFLERVLQAQQGVIKE